MTLLFRMAAPLLVLSVASLILPTAISAGSSDSMLLGDCQVWNADGEDVTANVLESDFINCQGSYACQNFTVANCPSVKCTGDEACFNTQILGVETLECQGTHSCHRAQVEFAQDRGKSMTCQGEGACDVTQIMGPSIELECFGRKACRKVNATIDRIHCTHGDPTQEGNEACTGYASIQTNCILCGWRGCNPHVNYCRTKAMDATPEDRWIACVPDQAIGATCTAADMEAVENEIQTKGEVLSAATLGESQDDQDEEDGN